MFGAAGIPTPPASPSGRQPENGHDPVLVSAVLALLDPKPGQIAVDCTLGRGGHALHIANRLGPTGLLIGIDADPDNLRFAAERLKSADCQVRLFHANFNQLSEVLSQAGQPQADCILADLGISTNQLFEHHYGMSFDRPMPLDMRIDRSTGHSAADLVNHLGETELANVLYELAQERYSRRIARKIVEARRVSPIVSTERLAALVRSAIPPRHGPPEKIDPATRTFLALRMAVNQEMQNLDALLKTAPNHLRTPAGQTIAGRQTIGGSLGIISFHSMEDRAVKLAFRSLEQTGQARNLSRKPIGPDESEIAANPRSRSAKLRAIQRCR